MGAEEQRRILVVDDDAEILGLLTDFLRKKGFDAEKAHSGEELLQRIKEKKYSLIILDVMMPGMSGLTAFERLREEQNIPVIFLSALGDSGDKILGLNLGADDYMAKPFSPGELLARINAVLRRSAMLKEQCAPPKEDAALLRFAGWTLNRVARHLISPDGTVVNLSGAEYRLLSIFLERPQEVLGRDALIAAMQGRELTPFDRSLDVQVCRLRSRLGDNGREAKLIKTVRGDGYVLSAKVHAVS